MFNELMFFVTVIVTFGLLTLVARIFGKSGIYAWIGMAVVVANVFVCKSVDLFGMSATLGNVLFGTVFLATDMLTEMYDVPSARRAVWLGAVIEICALCLTQIALQFVPNSIDVVHPSMQAIFGLFPRVTLASLSMFLFSNHLDIYLFSKIKEKTGGKYLWLRNNVATIISQCVENYLFYVIAFAGLYSMSDIFAMTLTSCIIEIIVAICDTPFLYIAIKSRGNRNETNN